jgi:hypothetical protein
MKLYEAIDLDEARGAGSFDYRYWFWAKKGVSYGLGYARQPIELDIQRKGAAAIDALDNIKDVLDTLEKEEKKKPELEVVERKIKANTKRLTGIVDLFGSPIVINWLNRDPPTTVTLPRDRKGDVTDLDGKDIDVVGIFRDPSTQEFVTEVMDWDKVKINDKEGDTLNTILAKFISTVFAPGGTRKSVRTLARGAGVEGVMKNLRFKDEKKGIEIAPFKPTDYKMFPSEMVGSKKMVGYLNTLVEKKFARVLKGAREAF